MSIIVWTHVLTHGLFFGIVVTGYLFVMMLTTSPRVWGYADYSEAIKAKAPPPTKEEKRLAVIISIPWMIFTLGFPIFSTYALKSKLGGEISFWAAFLNMFVLVLFATFGDLVILDWLIINKITPKFVIIPGTEKADYEDFSHHYKAHARSAMILVLLCVIVAGVVSYF